MHYKVRNISICLLFHKVNNLLGLTPAVMYCDGAFAPEDRRAPEYLQGETLVWLGRDNKSQGKKKLLFT